MSFGLAVGAAVFAGVHAGSWHVGAAVILGLWSVRAMLDEARNQDGEGW